jgi:hypothetical protein
VVYSPFFQDGIREISSPEPFGAGQQSLELFGRIQGDSGPLKVIKTKKRKKNHARFFC